MIKRIKPTIDSEILEFEESLLRSLDQAKQGQYATVHTPLQISARRERPVSSVNNVIRKWIKTHVKGY